MGVADGLPNSSVAAIVQDSRGFMWFGTQGGLVRWDGYEFSLFENIPFDDSSLSHNQIQTLFLDGEVLWVGTYGGLNRFDLKTETCRSYRHDPTDPSSLSDDLVIAIGTDSRGRLWVGTSSGLDRMDNDGIFTHYVHAADSPRSLPAPVVRVIHKDMSGKLWIGTSGGGLALYDPDRDDFDVFKSGGPDSLPSDYVMSISESSGGDLWIGCWYGGIARLTGMGRFESIPLADERVYFVNATVPSRVYAGTWGGGLFELDTDSGKINRYLSSDEKGSIPSDVVYSSFYDARGILWIGTTGGGICRTERSDLDYDMYLHDDDDPGSLSTGKVAGILEDRVGRIWVGVYSGGLNRLDPGSVGFKHYRRDPHSKRSLPSDIVNAIIEDSAGAIWIATNEGLARYEEKTDDFTVFRHDPNDPASIAESVVFSIAEAPNGDLWVGGNTVGLDRLDRQSGRFIHYPPDVSDPHSPGGGLVFALACEPDGTLWLGLNNGLERLEDGVFTRYRYDSKNRSGLASPTVRALMTDSKGSLWVGTVGGGLQCLLDAEAGTFSRISRDQGLPSSSARSILEADDGTIWVGTPSGLAIIDPVQSIARGFSVFNDLKDRDFHVGAWKARDGSLLFGGQSAFYRIYPDAAAGDTHTPPLLVVSSLKVGGNESHYMASPSYLKVLDLPYDGNSFSISFASVDYREPKSNRYSFFLEGFDKQWSPISSSHGATYTNLPGGRYVFRVRASDNEGYWNEDALALTIKVAFPPWLTPIAFVLYFAALVGMGYLVASVSMNRILRGKVRELTLVRAELEAANQRLSDLSLLDGLTGIANRRRLDAVLDMAHAESVREGKALSVLMLDIDYFKGYNDKYGHLAGDEILKSIARVLSHVSTRASDLVARYGGEEFVVVLPHTEFEGALYLAEKMRESVESLGHPNSASAISPVVTVSVGVASRVPGSPSSPESLIAEADAALYRAKDAGRNRISN